MLFENAVGYQKMEIEAEHPDAHQYRKIEVHEFSPVQTDYRTGNWIPNVEHGKNQDKEENENLGHIGRYRKRNLILLLQDFSNFLFVPFKIPFLGTLQPLPQPKD